MSPRQKKLPRVNINLELCEESHAQLSAIASTYNLSRTATLQQAIAKWYHTDPVVPKKETPRGPDHS